MMKRFRGAMVSGLGALALIPSGSPAAEVPEVSSLEEARQVIGTLHEHNEALRKRLAALLVGTEYPLLSVGEGDTSRVFHKVVVDSVEDGRITISHHSGRATIELASGPPEWRLLLADFDTGKAEAPSVPVTGTPDEVLRAIVVIEGDSGSGTGFLVDDGGATYLYSAAHVISGNKTLTVKLRDGGRLTKFGAFQASEGSDLIRIAVEEEVGHALTLTSTSSIVGRSIIAAGNSGGGGTVGFERGRVDGVGPESVEISAGVIQGNSGGPVLDAETFEVVGLVTHLVQGREDKWAKETRFSDIRRFGCRLDRTWKWRELPIGRFLAEGRAVGELTETNELLASALNPGEWSRLFTHSDQNHPIVREIRGLRQWIDERGGSGLRLSEADRDKRFAAVLRSIRLNSKAQLRGFNSESYVWFHREMADSALKWREELDEAYDATISDFR